MWNYMYTLSCIGEKKAKLKELSNNISDRSEAKGTGIMTDLLLNERSEVSGKSALYYIIGGQNFFHFCLDGSSPETHGQRLEDSSCFSHL